MSDVHAFYFRALWLERLTGIRFVWITGPVQLWLPGIPQYRMRDE